MTSAVSVKGYQAAARRLERAIASLKDRRQANRQVTVALYSWAIRNFDRGGALVGGWPPLAERTVREKERIGKQRIMVRTGELRQGFNTSYSNDDARIGNDVPYSVYHDSAEPRTSNLPRRQLLPSRDVVLDIGLRVYNAYIAKVTKSANR